MFVSDKARACCICLLLYGLHFFKTFHFIWNVFWCLVKSVHVSRVLLHFFSLSIERLSGCFCNVPCSLWLLWLGRQQNAKKHFQLKWTFLKKCKPYSNSKKNVVSRKLQHHSKRAVLHKQVKQANLSMPPQKQRCTPEL